MQDTRLIQGLESHVLRDPGDYGACTDLLELCRNFITSSSTRKQAIVALRTLAGIASRKAVLEDSYSDGNNWEQLHDLALLYAAKYDFDSYMLYVELDRDADKKFYPVRRVALFPIVQALQQLADDELDLLAISLPPGVGKSTLALFYLSWLGGKIPNNPILVGSHNNAFLRGVYDELLRIIGPSESEYRWKTVFPGVSVCGTNAKDMRIDLDRPQRFETFEFASVGAGKAGLVRAITLLYCDDLVDGMETALSKERLDKLWQQYTVDLRQRKAGACKELHIATRWSLYDPIGRLQEQYGDSERAKFIAVPAMNENDESNFAYKGSAGFTTEFYREQREIMDEPSWRALYMNQPIEREGQLFAPNELRRFFELPDGEPDAIISVCDTKDRGSDYCAMPVAYQYGEDYYIVDCVCDNGKPEIVEELICNTLLQHKVHLSRFESNSAGGKIAQRVQEVVRSRGGITKITTKYTTSNKETKIVANSPWVKEHCLFWDESLYSSRSRAYRKFMEMLCGYTMAGKNTHDDVPDSMAQLSEYAQSIAGRKVEVFKRPF